ncbi:integral membrane protein [Hypoxylon rubiginosum]|uniref:Integral membrane protein n=1 Tax=Hypoxylon rubiginosum TaxID=110542 RepID=A0ACC0DJT8_9PEZI|nr:integral membrane protein [Hypoxylon rubiginosum]
MQLPPDSVTESWPAPNYSNPESRGHAGLIVGVILIVLVTITLAIRLYARKWLTRGFGVDDILILAAYWPTTAFTIIGVVADERLHWNRHTWDVKPEFIVPGLQLVLADSILFDIAASLSKLSILTLLYRLSTASRDQKMIVAVLVSITVVSITCFVFIIVSVFQCTPLSEFWEPSDGPQNCINQSAHMLTANIVNTVTDWFVVLLPIKTVLGLRLPAKQANMIILLFGVGILASSVGIARSYYTSVLINNHDDIWNSWSIWLCSAVELNLGIICASIPATKPFFASYLPGVFDSTFKPRSSVAVDWDRKPLTQSPSLTTFIDQSSCSSTFLIPRPPPLITHHQPIDLNKPLPPIAYEQQRSPELRRSRSDGFILSPCSPDVPLPQRARVRFSDQNRRLAPTRSHSQDRTTIFIMYRGDSYPGSSQQTLGRASMV